MPVIKAQPCWTRFVGFDTSIKGTTILCRAMAEINVLDCRSNPKLAADLDARCRAAIRGAKDGGLGAMRSPDGKQIAPFRYAVEPIDTWNAYAVLAENAPGQTIVADCDCLSPAWAAWFKLAGVEKVGIGISQPKTRACKGGVAGPCGYGMAHAYTVLGLDGLPEWVRALCVPIASDPSIGAFDGSVLAGMPRPRDSFYGSGETAALFLRDE